MGESGKRQEGEGDPEGRKRGRREEGGSRREGEDKE